MSLIPPLSFYMYKSTLYTIYKRIIKHIENMVNPHKAEVTLISFRHFVQLNR